jgi:hypothetical protein
VRNWKSKEIRLLSGKDEGRRQASFPWPASIVSLFLCVLSGLELECLGVYVVEPFPFTNGDVKFREKD